MTLGSGGSGGVFAPSLLIFFELTGDYRPILLLMTSCILATLVANLLKNQSIYTQKLERKGIFLKEGREQTLLKSIAVRDVMSPKFAYFEDATPLSDVMTRALTDSQETYPVLDRNRRLVGVIRFRDLRAIVRDESIYSSPAGGDHMGAPLTRSRGEPQDERIRPVGG